MRFGHTITRESAEKLKQLLDQQRYQPPKRYINTRPFGGTGGGDALLAVTPEAGIAAMTTTEAPYSFPSAVCDLIDPMTGNYYSPNRTETIYSSVLVAINGDSLIQAKRIGTRYFVDVDNCPVAPE